MALETLESLQLKYETKMKEYTQLSQDYKELLQSGSNEYVQLKDKLYFGTSFLNFSQEDNINKCQALCSSNSKCSGADYLPSWKLCALSTGKGSVTPFPDIYTIMKKMQYITGKLEEVNNQLIILNKQIQDAIKNSPANNLDNLVDKNNNMHDTLITDYNNLLSQRRELNHLLVGYNNVNENMKDTSLVVNQHMLQYRLHTIILALILSLVVMIFGNMTISTAIIPLLLAFILFVLNFTLLSLLICVGMVLYYIYSIPME